MAKIPAEKMQEYRKRLAENSAKSYEIILSADFAEAMEHLGAKFWPGSEPGDIIKSLTMAAFGRMGKIASEQQRLLLEFAVDSETASAYLLNEVKRQTPLTAEEYLAFIGVLDQKPE